MTNLSKKLERLIKKNPEILPVKTKEGILVGSVLIKSDGPLKSLYKNNNLIYKDVHLNAVAIKLANLLARGKSTILCDQLYRADQEYNKWFIESQLLRTQYEKFKNSGDFERADISWARYCESRDRTTQAKNTAEALAKF